MASCSLFVRSFLCLLAAICCMGEAQSWQSPRDAFLNEYRPHPAFMRALEGGIAFRMSYQQFSGQTRRVVACDGVFAPFGLYINVSQAAKIDAEGKQSPGGTSVELINAKYTAFLESSGGPFRINSIDMAEEGVPPYSCYLAKSLCETRCGLPFAKAVHDPRVTVKEFENAQFAGAPVKRLRLSVNSKINKSFTMEFLNDYFFDPNKDWLCIAYRERSQMKKEEGIYNESILTFAEDPRKGYGIPVKIEQWDVDESKGTRVPDRFTDVSEVISRWIAPEEVRLSHFGLPEPVGVQWPATPSYWAWLGRGALVAGAIALLFWFLQSRSRTEVATKPLSP